MVHASPEALAAGSQHANHAEGAFSCAAATVKPGAGLLLVPRRTRNPAGKLQTVTAHLLPAVEGRGWSREGGIQGFNAESALAL